MGIKRILEKWRTAFCRGRASYIINHRGRREHREILLFSVSSVLSVVFDLSHDGGYAGVGERGIEKELERVAQFERFGFVRIDGVGGDGVVAYFTHR